MPRKRSVGRTAIGLEADTKGLRTDLNRANRILSTQLRRGAQLAGKGFDRALRSAIRTPLLRVGALVGAAFAGRGITRAFTNGLKEIRTEIDGLSKDAARIGLAVGEFQSLALAAEEAGASTNSITTAVGRLQEQIADATSGNQTAIASFDALGVSWERLATLNPFEALLATGDALQGLAGNANRFQQLGRDLFGRQFTDLAVLFRGGIRGATTDTRAFLDQAGATITEQQSRATQAQIDTSNRLTESFKGLGRILQGELSEGLLRITNKLVKDFPVVTDEFERFADRAGDAMDRLAKTIEQVDNVFVTLARNIESLVAAFGWVAGAAGVASAGGAIASTGRQLLQRRIAKDLGRTIDARKAFQDAAKEISKNPRVSQRTRDIYKKQAEFAEKDIADLSTQHTQALREMDDQIMKTIRSLLYGGPAAVTSYKAFDAAQGIGNIADRMEAAARERGGDNRVFRQARDYTQEPAPSVEPPVFEFNAAQVAADALENQLSSDLDRLEEQIAGVLNTYERGLTSFQTLALPFENTHREVQGLLEQAQGIPHMTSHVESLSNALTNIETARVNELARSLDDLKDQLDPLADPFRDLRRQLDQLQSTPYSIHIQTNINEVRDAIEDVAIQSSNYFQAAMSNIDAAIGDLVRNGKLQFKDLVASILADIAQLYIRENITRPILSAIVSSVAGAAGGGGAPAGKATGGRVDAGVPYMVGERGRELFVPATDGSIIPNYALQQRGKVNLVDGNEKQVIVNQTFTQGVDQQGLAYSLQRTKQETMKAVFDAIRDGGTARAIVASA